MGSKGYPLPQNLNFKTPNTNRRNERTSAGRNEGSISPNVSYNHEIQVSINSKKLNSPNPAKI